MSLDDKQSGTLLHGRDVTGVKMKGSNTSYITKKNTTTRRKPIRMDQRVQEKK